MCRYLSVISLSPRLLKRNVCYPVRFSVCVYINLLLVSRALLGQCFPVLKLRIPMLNMYSPSCLVFITGSILPILAVAIEIVHPDIVQHFADIQRQNPFDPRLVPHYHRNGSVIREDIIDITLAACQEKCGTGWNVYPSLETQKCLASWMIPLFLLIGSMHYASLGAVNTISVIIHLLGDPISSFESLLSKLRRLQKHHRECARDLAYLPNEVQKAVAMILAAYEEWDHDVPVYMAQGVQFGLKPQKNGDESAMLKNENQEQHKDMFHVLKDWLSTSRHFSSSKQLQKQRVCLQAANEMSDCRVSGLAKTLLGLMSYAAALATSFIHIKKGDYNYRTGHTIAYAMLYSWLVASVLLCSIVGGYATKRSSEDVLRRLYLRFEAIEVEYDIHRQSRGSIPTISRLCSSDNYAESSTYQSLEWSGGNSTFRPRQSCWGERKLWTSCVAHLPTLFAVINAFAISYTSPTVGVGCRSISQALYGASWIASASITRIILYTTESAYRQWLYVRIKDSIVAVAQAIVLFMIYLGWFNSCFCWSASFSLGADAHVLLTPYPMIQHLATTKWLALSLPTILGQLFLVACIWAYFRDGANLFHVSEHERYQGRLWMPPRVERMPPRMGTFSDRGGLGLQKE